MKNYTVEFEFHYNGIHFQKINVSGKLYYRFKLPNSLSGFQACFENTYMRCLSNWEKEISNWEKEKEKENET